jgi:single-stranded-DNA-specific exonuclease
MTDLFRKNIQKAIQRLKLAKKRNEKIVLWGDYDADGIAGTLIAYEGLKYLGFNNLLISLCDRRGIYEEGEEEIERLAKGKVDLIISIDFGIVANKEIKFARQKGIDFIVLDHHTPPKIFPKGIIVNYSNGRYKNKAAAGVVFELIKAFYKDRKIKEKEIEKFLDVVAIATVADRIVLTKANKKIIIEGIKRINKGCRPALLALVKKIRSSLGNKKLTPNNFERFIGRIDFAEGANKENNLFKLMSSEVAESEIKELVDSVEKNYRKAQKIINTIYKENVKELSVAELKVAFVENNINWPLPGVNGLVAEEISNKLNRPVFVYNRSGDKIKVSGRAPQGFNLVKALRSCPAEVFHNVGGHPRAAGFKAKIDNLEKIKECLKKYYQRRK